MMIAETNKATRLSHELLGDMQPLLEQMGAAGEIVPSVRPADGVCPARVVDLPSLRGFLNRYRESVLVPVELPAIVAAYQHAARGEAMELIALDRQLRGQAALRPFAAASCRVGQRQLGKLRPLRDQRLVQRYLAAIESGEALGWHTLVYGVSLAMFSLPLRQGLQNYIEHTVRGFAQSSAGPLRLTEAECDALSLEQAAQVPHDIEYSLGKAPATQAMPVAVP